jgi:NAD(P)-dependent dehydrogenase (short-subunit alcohol dehydrogenase family)
VPPSHCSAATPTGLDAVLGEVRDAGGHGVAVAADVTAPVRVGSALEAVERELGPVDLLVNNAGVRERAEALPWDQDAEDWWHTVAVNVRGPYLLARAVLPGMIGRGRGRILNVGSGYGARADAGYSAYAVSKAALSRLSECLALAADGTGVVVVEASPGIVRTDMTATMWSAPPAAGFGPSSRWSRWSAPSPPDASTSCTDGSCTRRRTPSTTSSAGRARSPRPMPARCACARTARTTPWRDDASAADAGNHPAGPARLSVTTGGRPRVTDQPEGFGEFVAARGPALQRTAWLLTGNWATAEDLVQTALAKTWPHWHRILRRDEPELYVRRVMVTTYASWWRRRWRGEVATGLVPEQGESGDSQDDAVLRELVRVALAALPPRQRAVSCSGSSTTTRRRAPLSCWGARSAPSRARPPRRWPRLRADAQLAALLTEEATR